jgi:hypothetical protein
MRETLLAVLPHWRDLQALTEGLRMAAHRLVLDYGCHGTGPQWPLWARLGLPLLNWQQPWFARLYYAPFPSGVAEFL